MKLVNHEVFLTTDGGIFQQISVKASQLYGFVLFILRQIWILLGFILEKIFILIYSWHFMDKSELLGNSEKLNYRQDNTAQINFVTSKKMYARKKCKNKKIGADDISRFKLIFLFSTAPAKYWIRWQTCMYCNVYYLLIVSCSPWGNFLHGLGLVLICNLDELKQFSINEYLTVSLTPHIRTWGDLLILQLTHSLDSLKHLVVFSTPSFIICNFILCVLFSYGTNWCDSIRGLFL